MRAGSVSLVQFLFGWFLSVVLGATAVIMLGLPGLVVLVGLMIGAHLLLSRRTAPRPGPELPRGPTE